MVLRALVVIKEITAPAWLYDPFRVLMVHIQIWEELLRVTCVQQATHVLIFPILQKNVTMASLALLERQHVRYCVKSSIA